MVTSVYVHGNHRVCHSFPLSCSLINSHHSLYTESTIAVIYLSRCFALSRDEDDFGHDHVDHRGCGRGYDRALPLVKFFTQRPEPRNFGTREDDR